VGATSESGRLSPRLHHVRGHIVRRGASVFWRSPHMRGSARLGQVRSRTVDLTYGKTAEQLIQRDCDNCGKDRCIF
jgi:hypothetical protein